MSIHRSVGRLVRGHESKREEMSVLDAFCACEWGTCGVDWGWMLLPTRLQRYCDPALLVFFFNISRSYLTHMRGNTAHFWTGLIKRPASKFLHWDLPDVRFDFVWASTKKVKNKNKVKNKKKISIYFLFHFHFSVLKSFCPLSDATHKHPLFSFSHDNRSKFAVYG